MSKTKNEEYTELVTQALGDLADERTGEFVQDFLGLLPDFQALKEINGEQIEEIGSWSPRMRALLAAIKLGRLAQLSQRPVIGHAYSSFALGTEMLDHFNGREQESVCLILTNVHNDIIDLEEVFKGGQSECQLYPEQIYRRALLKAATGIAVIHNHPSGLVEPSQQDLQMVKRLQKGCRLLNLHFLDFMIIGHNSYYSWRENQSVNHRQVG